MFSPALCGAVVNDFGKWADGRHSTERQHCLHVCLNTCLFVCGHIIVHVMYLYTQMTSCINVCVFVHVANF